MTYSLNLERRLLDEIMLIRAVDVHSHVPHREPFARSLRELLGYHYYTELAHSAGLAKDAIAQDRPDEEVIPALLSAMEAIDNTVQYGWMIELARTLFGFGEDKLTRDNWQPLAHAVQMAAETPGRARQILETSRIEKVFLTNNFDEDLSGIETEMFVPSLRADTLVFKLHDPAVREALERVSGSAVSAGSNLREAIASVVARFRASGARSAAISLPPLFCAPRVEDAQFDAAVERAVGGAHLTREEAVTLQSGTMFALADACGANGLPFQVMCGALRDAYEDGVPQGRDLPQSGDTLRGLLPLLNAFPNVTFCVSVLSESQSQELASYGWLLPNVVPSGHWWYANVPAFIARELAGRLQCVPKTKLIGYYSDMYKLEFGLAKFNMYRRVLSRVLARECVEPGLVTEEDALTTARLLLAENPKRIFSV